MASLSDFGLGPEAPESERRRARRDARYADESGARRLPTEPYYEPYDVDPLDEEVELPGVSPRRGLFFGIGAGIGVALLSVFGGLYFGGYIARPPLASGPELASVQPDLALFEEWQNVEALERATIAPVWIDERSGVVQPTVVESPDIRVIDETRPALRPLAEETTPAPAEETTGEDSSGLANELDELERSLRPRGPTAPPKPPNDDRTTPESRPLPAPAEPTAPAETRPPGELF